MIQLDAIDWGLLKSFLAVHDTGSFSRAAESLGRTQAALSQQIKKLEIACDAPLIIRDRKKLKLTRQGERLLAHAQRFASLYRDLYRDFDKGAIAGPVRLGVPEDIATRGLPELLAKFTKAHPDVQPEVDCDLTANLYRRFQKGAYDLVVLKRDPSVIGEGEGLVCWHEKLVWVCSAQNAQAPDIQADKAVPLVCSPAPCVYRKRAIAALDGVGQHWRLAYSTTSLAGNIAAVKAGLGFAVMPKAMVPKSLAIVPARAGLPNLHDTDIVMLTRAHDLSPAGAALARAIPSMFV
ncbi:MAG: LysR family transcriptional regulator [Proteobacteria bacterium]|nr:LysR family transcriptional regulator [Pseudomonadota bacterium]